MSKVTRDYGVDFLGNLIREGDTVKLRDDYTEEVTTGTVLCITDSNMWNDASATVRLKSGQEVKRELTLVTKQ